MASVLFLRSDTRRDGVFMTNLVFGIAAGIAMAFATIVTFLSQNGKAHDMHQLPVILKKPVRLFQVVPDINRCGGGGHSPLQIALLVTQSAFHDRAEHFQAILIRLDHLRVIRRLRKAPHGVLQFVHRGISRSGHEREMNHRGPQADVFMKIAVKIIRGIGSFIDVKIVRKEHIRIDLILIRIAPAVQRIGEFRLKLVFVMYFYGFIDFLHFRLPIVHGKECIRNSRIIKSELNFQREREKQKKEICPFSLLQTAGIRHYTKKAIHFESPAIFDSGGGYRVRTSDLWIMIPSL